MIGNFKLVKTPLHREDAQFILRLEIVVEVSGKRMIVKNEQERKALQMMAEVLPGSVSVVRPVIYSPTKLVETGDLYINNFFGKAAIARAKEADKKFTIIGESIEQTPNTIEDCICRMANSRVILVNFDMLSNTIIENIVDFLIDDHTRIEFEMDEDGFVEDYRII
jgi:hypothetical protein